MPSVWPRICALALATVLGACNRVETRPAAEPAAAGAAANVLLVTIDTLRADRVGVYGAARARTPTLDALATQGTRFETAIAPAPLTLPSHATLMTGQLPPSHGVRNNGIHRLAPEAVTLAERLRDAGHATGAVVAAAVLDTRYGLAQGFDHYDDARGVGADSGTFLTRSATSVTNGAEAWLRDAPRPFFLWVHYFDPHAPYSPPPPFRDELPPYDGEVAYVDAELGRLLDQLRTSGDLDTTLVVATADHGESLGEHGEGTHSHTVYDATQRVPLLLRGPGVPVGRVVQPVVSSADLAPTLLGLLGLEPLPAPDGRDLGPLLGGAEPAPEPAYAETLATRYEHGWAPLHALRSDRHLYIRAPRPELYDVRSDPGQQHDLLATSDPGAAEVAARLEASLAERLAVDRTAPERDVDVETREQLAALGYVLPENAPAASDTDPKDGLKALAAFEAGFSAYTQGRFPEAIAILESARESLPASPRLLSTLAHAQLRSGRPDLALEPIQEAARLSAESAGYRAVLGDCLRQLGRTEEAELAYEQAVDLDPEEPLGLLGLQWAAARAGDPEAAERHAARAIAATGGDAGTWVRVALAWESGSELARARAALERAVAADPSHRVAQLLLGIALLRDGKSTQATPHLDRAGPLVDHPRYRARLEEARASGAQAGATSRSAR